MHVFAHYSKTTQRIQVQEQCLYIKLLRINYPITGNSPLTVG